MDPKALKKLVKTCREMGITHYKGVDFEFTLSLDAPAKKDTKKSAKVANADDKEEFETDSLTEEQLLMWSASPGGAEISDQEGV